MVASLVGIPLEVDKFNLKKWEYVGVKIGCKDVVKVRAVVEGLLDMHFHDFVDGVFWYTKHVHYTLVWI
jgi:hypothetical protein